MSFNCVACLNPLIELQIVYSLKKNFFFSSDLEFGQLEPVSEFGFVSISCSWEKRKKMPKQNKTNDLFSLVSSLGRGPALSALEEDENPPPCPTPTIPSNTQTV